MGKKMSRTHSADFRLEPRQRENQLRNAPELRGTAAWIVGSRHHTPLRLILCSNCLVSSENRFRDLPAKVFRFYALAEGI